MPGRARPCRARPGWAGPGRRARWPRGGGWWKPPVLLGRRSALPSGCAFLSGERPGAGRAAGVAGGCRPPNTHPPRRSFATPHPRGAGSTDSGRRTGEWSAAAFRARPSPAYGDGDRTAGSRWDRAAGGSADGCRPPDTHPPGRWDPLTPPGGTPSAGRPSATRTEARCAPPELPLRWRPRRSAPEHKAVGRVGGREGPVRCRRRETHRGSRLATTAAQKAITPG
jgi:hypothetical protein